MIDTARQMKRRFKVYRKVNWTKTLYFNFKMFPFAVARKIPVFFYGKVRFGELDGKIGIEGEISRGMVGFGHPYELKRRSAGTAELIIQGNLVFKGHVQFGPDYTVYVAKGVSCTMGDMSSLGFNSKLLCFDDVQIGSYARIGFETQIINSTLHPLIDTDTGERLPMTGKVVIGDFNYIGNRSTIAKGTVTPNRCVVAMGSHCNKDYTDLGTNIMIGGMPAKLLRTSISRDWEGEMELLHQWIKGQFQAFFDQTSR